MVYHLIFIHLKLSEIDEVEKYKQLIDEGHTYPYDKESSDYMDSKLKEI